MHIQDHQRRRGWRRSGHGATEHSRHYPMPRFGIGGHGVRWDLGWDEGTRTFYALYSEEADEGGFALLEAFGTAPAEHPSIESLEAALGLPVPAGLREALEHERLHPHPGRCRRGGWGQ